MNYDDAISPELKEKLKGCESVEELSALIKGEGLELTDEQMDAIVGGGFNTLWYGCSDTTWRDEA